MQQNSETMADVKALLFDYGGTLDTHGCHWGKKLWHIYRQMNMPISEEQYREAYVYGERSLAARPLVKPHHTFYKTLSIKLRLQLEHLCTQGAWFPDKDAFEQTHQRLLQLAYEGVKETTTESKKILEQLKPHYQMALVTNFYGNIHQVLEEFELTSFFDTIVESAVVKIRKPDPAIFSLAIKALKLEPHQTAVIGDSYYKDIEPGHKLGCKTIWLKGEGWNNKQYNEDIPTHIITSLTQLMQLY